MKTAVLVLAAWLLAACGQAPGAGSVPAGRPAPPVKLKLLQAPQAELLNWASLAGKVVVLEFWATWCDSCVEEMPHLNALADQFKAKPVVFLSITDEDEATVREFLKTHELRGWIGLDGDLSAMHGFGVRGRPKTVVLDASGRIIGETFPALLTPEMLDAALAGKEAGLRPSEPAAPADDAGAAVLVRIGPAAGNKPETGSEPNRVEGRAMPLANLVEEAYGIESGRIFLGEGFTASDRYDYLVSVPMEAMDRLAPLFQEALCSALGLKVRWETKTLEVLVLSGRPKAGAFKTPAAKTMSGMKTGPGMLNCSNLPMNMIVRMLQDEAGKVIVDETGLQARYDAELAWSPPGDKDALAKAVGAAWGLGLKPAQRPVRILRVEKRPAARFEKAAGAP